MVIARAENGRLSDAGTGSCSSRCQAGTESVAAQTEAQVVPVQWHELAVAEDPDSRTPTPKSLRDFVCAMVAVALADS